MFPLRFQFVVVSPEDVSKNFFQTKLIKLFLGQSKIRLLSSFITKKKKKNKVKLNRFGRRKKLQKIFALFPVQGFSKL